jgi:hypothetical protein
VVRRGGADGAGLLRVALVGVFTLSLLAHVGAVGEYFSDESMIAGDQARQAFKSRWSLFFWFPDPTAVRALFAVGVVAHVMWLVGLYTRVAAVVAAAIWLSMVGRNPLLYSMPDQLHSCLIVWLALMPSGRGVSLDARWRGKGGPVPVWCRRIVQLQIAVVYTTTGLLKSGATWQADGTAIYYALANPYNRHFDATGLLASLQPYVLRPITWSVLLWEVAFGGFVAGAVAARGDRAAGVPGPAQGVPRVRRAHAPRDPGDAVRGVVHTADAGRVCRVPAAGGGEQAD